ncbi:hypothetical protein FJ950_10385 [Mesorhizobium sp. B2-3-14]|uniref:DUF6074 family protein n=1 Tax=Mesorhizobium sp. B2-3-14 TaxID=2589950 RepID=UPI0011299E37|nr:DUF6074 family protein [Mesorhizobium sp. B2-3-14]TPL86800.1 hypothetical protein FJ950_10385 [Mesorhizobium sp. B2-3-14]
MSAIVIPFPAARRAGKVRRAAQELIKRAGERRQGEGCWQNVVRQTAARMAASGVDGNTIDRELNDFSRAVCFEMARLQTRHGGAA